MDRKECLRKIETYAGRVSGFAWEDPQCYASWLSQTFHFVSHSTRLIALAASRFYLDQEGLHNRFLAHIHEEKSHEKLAIHDIKALGLEPANFPELSVTKGFYRSQYYFIERVDAASFLGYIMALEGIAVYAGPVALKKVQKAHGIKAASFLKVHSEEDVEHIEQALNQFDQLTPKAQAQTYENLIQSGELYCQMLDRIEARHQRFHETSPTSAA
jgi:thiaminase